jgi:tetratricopeptide (TPR) repeat protein
MMTTRMTDAMTLLVNDVGPAEAAMRQRIDSLSALLLRRDTAIEELQKSLLQAHKALNHGGTLLQEMSGVAQAFDAITRELTRLPLSAAQICSFAEIFASTRNFEEAELFLERALQQDPGNDAVRKRLRSVYQEAPRLMAPAPGRAVSCPCCKGHFRLFMPFGATPRPNAMCPNCGSLERHRLMQLYFERRTNLFSARLRVLHFAPEECFSRVLDHNPLIDYLSADLHAPGAKQKIDITDIPYADGSFDVVLCSHVLEHIPDDRRAMRELRRVLAPHGWALLQVPIDHQRAVTFEDPSITDPAQRERLFGQHDHVRWYGRDYVSRLVESGFHVRVDEFFGEFAPELIRQYGLMPGEDMHLCTKAPGRA